MRTFLLATLATILFSLIALAKAPQLSRTISITNAKAASLLSKMREVPTALLSDHPRSDDGRFAMLLLGKAGEGWTAGELTDTIILIVLENDRHRAEAISLPRDLLVRTPFGTTMKINALWEIGKRDAMMRGKRDIAEAGSLVRQAVETITGVPVDELVVVDVAAASSLIDALGGIAVNVTERIDDPSFPTPGGGIERFTIEPGFHVLDGAAAIKYARTRHTPEGDFGRIRRQQQVIEAVLAKARGLHLADDPSKIEDLFRAFEGRIETTMSPFDLPLLIRTALAIPLTNIRTFTLDTLGREPLLKSGGGTTLVPRAGPFEYREIHEAVARVLTESDTP